MSNTLTGDLTMRIDRAIVPAAGLGTRLRPLTLAIPKEMLPLGRKPVLEYVVEELRAAGIGRILFIISPGKEMIRAYFGEGERFGLRFDYVTQPEMRGLGDALLHGEAWTEGGPFVVAFGDCVIEGRGARGEGRGARGEGRGVESPLNRVIQAHCSEGAAAVALAEWVRPEQTGKYGILATAGEVGDAQSGYFRLTDIVEKPQPENAPSRWAVAARWTLDLRIFEYLRKATLGPDGELNLTDAVRAMMRDGAPVWAVPLAPDEGRVDVGGWETYLTASARAAANDGEFGARVREGL